jgi:hypothetical protein
VPGESSRASCEADVTGWCRGVGARQKIGDEGPERLGRVRLAGERDDELVELLSEVGPGDQAPEPDLRAHRETDG